MMTIPRYLDLNRLVSELSAAGVSIQAVGTFLDTTGALVVHTYDANGNIVDLPAVAQKVIDAHTATPPPVEVPNILGIITALAQSTSLDQATKDRLTAALKGP